MKEAAGEANMTVITIVLIAVVLGAGMIIVRTLTQNTKRQSCCTSAGGTWTGGTCENGGDAYNSCIAGDGEDDDVNIG